MASNLLGNEIFKFLSLKKNSWIPKRRVEDARVLVPLPGVNRVHRLPCTSREEKAFVSQNFIRIRQTFFSHKQ